MTPDPKSVVRRYAEELFSQGKLEVADEIIHPQPRYKTEGGMWSKGPDGVKDLVLRSKQSAPDIRRIVHDMVSEDNKVVLHSTIEGTHTGEGGYIPVPPTGVKFALTGVATFIVENGRIVEEPWNNWDFGQLFEPVYKAHVMRYFDEAWSSRDPGVLGQFFSPDYVGHIRGSYAGRTGQGRDAVINLFSSMWDAFPDLEVEVGDQVVDGDKVSNRIVMSGTPTKPFFGYQPTGSQVSREGVMTFRIGGGKFVEGWAVWGPFIEE